MLDLPVNLLKYSDLNNGRRVTFSIKLHTIPLLSFDP